MSSSFVYFPIQHNKKTPTMKWGNITRSIVSKHHNDNRAIKTGSISDLTVFDLDLYKCEGKNPFTEEFGKKFIKKFNTYTVKTPSGGYHLYFKYNEQIGTTTNNNIHVDIRNDGAYIVAPPSSINEKPYKVVNDVPLRKVPHKLVKFYREHIISNPVTDKPTKKIKKITNKSVINKMIQFDLDSSDWSFLLDRLHNDYLEDFSHWIKATMASKYLGFFNEWDKWSKKGSKYDDMKNAKIWDSLNFTNEEATINTVKHICNMGLSTDNQDNLSILAKDGYAGKCYFRPYNDKLAGYEEIRKTKLDDINGDVRFFKTSFNYLVKSDTGTGKSTAFRKYAKDQDSQFISLVSRVSLGLEQFEDMKDEGIECKFYQNHDFSPCDSLIITPESLPIISNYSFENYIVFMDEFNSIIEHILQSSTLNRNRVLVLFMIMKILRTCKQFICVDADISSVALEFLESVGVSFKFYLNTYKHFQNVRCTFINSEEEILNKIIKEDKYLLCSDSKTSAENYKLRLEKAGHKDIKLITSDNDPSEVMRLDNHDKVIFSPKIIYGLDSKIRRSVYGIYKGNTISPPQMIQQIARCRNIIDVHVFFENVGSSMPLYDTPCDVSVKLEVEINKQLLLYYKLEQYERSLMKENGVIYLDEEYDEVQDPEDIANKLFMNAVIDTYKPLMKIYNFKIDSFNTNKKIHFKKILETRGFEVIDNRKSSIGKFSDNKEIKKDILQKKLDEFDVENPIIKKRLKILKIPKDKITEDMKEIIIDGYKLRNYFNYVQFEKYNIIDLMEGLKNRRDFEDKKIKSDRRQIIILKNMLECLKLKKDDLRYQKQGIKKSIYEKIGKEYIGVSESRRSMPIKTDSDIYDIVITMYNKLFGTIKVKRSKFRKGQERQKKVEFNEYKNTFDEIMKYQYRHIKEVKAEYENDNDNIDLNAFFERTL